MLFRSGNVGAEVVAKSPADGYTLLMGTVGTHGINRALYAKLPYDPIKDFAPITVAASNPYVLAVNASVPARNLAEFVAYARREGADVKLALNGIGAPAHFLTVKMLEEVALRDVQLIPYQDGTTVKNPATSGHMGSPVFKWICGPGATNPMPAKYLPGSCRGS